MAMPELVDLWAHIPIGGTGPHRLSDYLTSTGGLTREFAERFGLAKLGALLGLWYDLGKAHPGFQRYLKSLADGRPELDEPLGDVVVDWVQRIPDVGSNELEGEISHLVKSFDN